MAHHPNGEVGTPPGDQAASAVFETAFETAIGRCGIAWSDRGVRRVRLPGLLSEPRPDGEPDLALAGPPPMAVDAIDRITALLRGEPADLSGIPLDTEGVPEFHQRVYAIARRIPPGSTITYGEIARELGDPGASRAVGQALGRNPFPIVVPCHRVLAAGGKSGGFSAPGGVTTKMRLLGIEGAAVPRTLPLFRT